MARKSKGKFNMKGHSIPGIKGFKNTTLEDGRAASSAFQMQSPLHEEDDGSDAYELDDINIKSSDYDPNRAEKQAAGQSGLGYMGQEFGKLEWRDGKLVRKGSEVEEEKDEIMTCLIDIMSITCSTGFPIYLGATLPPIRCIFKQIAISKLRTL